jgi:hypothetical protein
MQGWGGMRYGSEVILICCEAIRCGVELIKYVSEVINFGDGVIQRGGEAK